MLLLLLRMRLRVGLLHLLRMRLRARLLHLLRTRLRTRLLCLLRLRTIFLTRLLLRLGVYFRRTRRLRFWLTLGLLLRLRTALRLTCLLLRGAMLLRLLGHRRVRLRPCRLTPCFRTRLLPRLTWRTVLLCVSVRIGAVSLRRVRHAIRRTCCLAGLFVQIGHLRRRARPGLRLAATLRLSVRRRAGPLAGLLHALLHAIRRTRCCTRRPPGHMRLHDPHVLHRYGSWSARHVRRH
jgi:hypothetical protein